MQGHHINTHESTKTAIFIHSSNQEGIIFVTSLLSRFWEINCHITLSLQRLGGLLFWIGIIRRCSILLLNVTFSSFEHINTFGKEQSHIKTSDRAFSWHSHSLRALCSTEGNARNRWSRSDRLLFFIGSLNKSSSTRDKQRLYKIIGLGGIVYSWPVNYMQISDFEAGWAL